MIFSITGFMGAGKSTVAPLVAKRLNRPYYDLDQLIEAREGISVAEIFSIFGEKRFREAENRTLMNIMRQGIQNKEYNRSFILSLGGGTLISPSNRIIVKEESFCIYLRTSPETIALRIKEDSGKRPLINEKDDIMLIEKIKTLLAEREKGYLECARLVLDTDGLTAGECADRITENIRKGTGEII